MCHACGDVVTGDVVRVGDRAWHPDHFRCHSTNRLIGGDEFAADDDGEVYLQAEHSRLFGKRCFMCDETVAFDDLEVPPPDELASSQAQGGALLCLVPLDAPTSYHAGCLRCVATDADVRGEAFLGLDDGLAYCEAAFQEKYSTCFASGVPLDDRAALDATRSLPLCEAAFRSLFGGAWCPRCAKPLDDPCVDLQQKRWHQRCAAEWLRQSADGGATDGATLDQLVDAAGRARNEYRAAYELKVEAYGAAQRHALDDARQRARDRRRTAAASALGPVDQLGSAVEQQARESSSSSSSYSSSSSEAPSEEAAPTSADEPAPAPSSHDAPADAPPTEPPAAPSEEAAAASAEAPAPAPSSRTLFDAFPIPAAPSEEDEAGSNAAAALGALLCNRPPPPPPDYPPPPTPTGPFNAPTPTGPFAAGSADDDAMKVRIAGWQAKKEFARRVAAAGAASSEDGAVASDDGAAAAASEDGAAAATVAASSAEHDGSVTRMSSFTRKTHAFLAGGAAGRATLLEGVLSKKGGGTSLFGRRSWRKRYFVLSEAGNLSYYRDAAAHAAGAEPLKNAMLDVSAAEVCDEGERRIAITPRGSTASRDVLRLRADDDTAFDEWFAALRKFSTARRG